jgi:hypothetical protein
VAWTINTRTGDRRPSRNRSRRSVRDERSADSFVLMAAARRAEQDHADRVVGTPGVAGWQLARRTLAGHRA